MTTTSTLPNPPELDLSEKQWYSLGASDGRVNIWEGSIRSGKTFVSFLRFCGFIATYQGPGSMVMIGKSRDTLWRNIFEPIELDDSLAFLRPFVQYRQGATVAYIFGVRVNVLGANDAKAEGKIRGMTVAGAYGDEVTTWTVEFFKQLLGRMSPAGAQFFGTTNPDNPRHWLKADYLDKLAELPNWRHFHFTLDDNTTLSAEFRDSLRREFTGLWYLRFIEGLWVSAEGAIYPEWNERTHTIAWRDTPPLQRLLSVGIDFGMTNATSAVLLGITDEYDANGSPTPRLIVLDEWRWDSRKEKRRLAPSDQARRLKAWLQEDHTPYDLDLWPEYVHVDPSAAPLAEELEKAGVTTWDADNSVGAGIGDIANLLAQGRMIVTDRCKGITAEAPGYVWDEKAAAKGHDEPVKSNDHSMDAWRYAVRSTKGVWQPILRAAYALAA